MKLLLIFLNLFILEAYAKTDWKNVYDKLENRTEKLTIKEYIEACEDNVQLACLAGWNSQLNLIKLKGYIDEFEEPLNPIFINRINEVCEQNNFQFCTVGLEKLGASLKTAKQIVEYKISKTKEQEDLIKERGDTKDKDLRDKLEKLRIDEDYYQKKFVFALDSYNKNSYEVCEKNYFQKLNLLYCENYFETNLEEAEKLVQNLERSCTNNLSLEACEMELKALLKFKLSEKFGKNLVNNYIKICSENKKLDFCNVGLNVSKELNYENEFIQSVCNKDSIIDQLSPCQLKIKQKKAEIAAIENKQQMGKMKTIASFSFFLFILIVFIIFKMNKCSSCGKYFSFRRIKAVQTIDENDSDRKISVEEKKSELEKSEEMDEQKNLADTSIIPGWEKDLPLSTETQESITVENTQVTDSQFKATINKQDKIIKYECCHCGFVKEKTIKAKKK